MSKITGQTYRSIPAVLNHTITSQDVTDGYVTADFKVNSPLAAMVSCTNQDGNLINMNTAKITYPEDGQVKVEASGVGIAEKTTITTVADVANSLGGKYLLLSSSTVNYYTWFDSTGISEVSSVDTIADTEGSLGGATEVNEISSVDAVADVAGSLGGADAISEISSVDAVADVAGSLSGVYFDISSTTVDYRVWYNVDAGSSAPDLTDKTGVEVAISTGALSSAVASATETALEALGAGSGAVFAVTIAGVGTDEMTITHTIAGVCTDASAGTSGFTVAVDTQGVDQILSKYFDINSTTVEYRVWYNADSEGTAPDLTGKTGVEIAISKNDLSSTVASATETALEALGGGGGAVFNVTVAGTGSDEMTITHTVGGACNNVLAGTSGFTVAVDTSGVTAEDSKYFDISSPTVNYRVWYNDGEGSEPDLAGRTGIEVTIIKNETLANVATKTKAVLDALGSSAVFSTAIGGGGSNEMTITNLVRGLATDAAAGTSGFTVATDVQGVAKSTDPAVSSRTAIEVPLVTGDSANTVATKLRTVLEAHVAFTASVVNNVVTVTNSVVGKALDAGAGNSGFTVSISDQGVSVINALVFEAGNKLTFMAFRDANQ